MEAVFCVSCERKQSPGWQVGQLCQHCGSEVRREQRCGWCCQWTPSGKFCRRCGFEQVSESLFGAARMLKQAGVDQLSLPARLHELPPERQHHYGMLYQQQLAVVIQRVADVEFLQSYLVTGGHATALEARLIEQLPLDEKQLDALNQGPQTTKSTDLFTHALAIYQQSNIETTRQLALIVMMRVASPETLEKHASTLLSEIIPLVSQSAALRLEVCALLASWKMWSPELQLDRLPANWVSLLLPVAKAVLEHEQSSVRHDAAVVLARLPVTLDSALQQRVELQLEEGLTSKNIDEQLTSAILLGRPQQIAQCIDFQNSWRSVTGVRQLARLGQAPIANFIRQGAEVQLEQITLVWTTKYRPELSDDIVEAFVSRLSDRNHTLNLSIVQCLCAIGPLDQAHLKCVAGAAKRYRLLAVFETLLKSGLEEDKSELVNALFEMRRINHFRELLLTSGEWVRMPIAVLQGLAEEAWRDNSPYSLEEVTWIFGQQAAFYNDEAVLASAFNVMFAFLAALLARAPATPRAAWLTERLLTATGQSLCAMALQHRALSKRVVHQVIARFSPADFPESRTLLTHSFFLTPNGLPSDFLELAFSEFGLNERFTFWLEATFEHIPLPANMLLAILNDHANKNALTTPSVSNLIRTQSNLNGEGFIRVVRQLVEWALDAEYPLLAENAVSHLSEIMLCGNDVINEMGMNVDFRSSAGWLSMLYGQPDTLIERLCKALLAPENTLVDWLLKHPFSSDFESVRLGDHLKAALFDGLIRYMMHRTNGEQVQYAGYLASKMVPAASDEYFRACAVRLQSMPCEDEGYYGLKALWQAYLGRWFEVGDKLNCLIFCMFVLDEKTSTVQVECAENLIRRNDLTSLLSPLERLRMLDQLRMSAHTTASDNECVIAERSLNQLFEMLAYEVSRQAPGEFGSFVIQHLAGENHRRGVYETLVDILKPEVDSFIRQSRDRAEVHECIEQFVMFELQASLGEGGYQVVSERQDDEFVSAILMSMMNHQWTFNSENCQLIEALFNAEQFYPEYQRCLAIRFDQSLAVALGSSETDARITPEQLDMYDILSNTLTSLEESMEMIKTSLASLPDEIRVNAMAQTVQGQKESYHMIKTQAQILPESLQLQISERIRQLLDIGTGA
ncbi:MAG: hypothetical protein H6999_11555 [Hahellaceae bacterium]|nr:hypothetical protein [Hahellaceae bacterium]